MGRLLTPIGLGMDLGGAALLASALFGRSPLSLVQSVSPGSGTHVHGPPVHDAVSAQMKTAVALPALGLGFGLQLLGAIVSDGGRPDALLAIPLATVAGLFPWVVWRLERGALMRARLRWLLRAGINPRIAADVCRHEWKEQYRTSWDRAHGDLTAAGLSASELTQEINYRVVREIVYVSREADFEKLRRQRSDMDQ